MDFNSDTCESCTMGQTCENCEKDVNNHGGSGSTLHVKVTFTTKPSQPTCSLHNSSLKRFLFGLTLLAVLVGANLLASSQAFRSMSFYNHNVVQAHHDHNDDVIKPRKVITERSDAVSDDVIASLARYNIYVFRNVCLELLEPPLVETFKNATYNISRRIVVYNSRKYVGKRKLHVSASNNVGLTDRSWVVTFTPDPVPLTHDLHNRTAIFVVQVQPGNLHHFWEEEFQHLYSLARRLHRLGLGSTNQILYKHAPEAKRAGFDRYELFYSTLNIHPVREAYFRLPIGTCFDQAVFGQTNFKTLPRKDTAFAVHHVLNRNHLDRKRCQKYYVTLIQRANRKILNMEELRQAAVGLGFNNTEVVKMESLSSLEQLRRAACSRVIVGTQGAGLQWAIFMPQHSLLVEITWPTRHWARLLWSRGCQVQNEIRSGQGQRFSRASELGILPEIPKAEGRAGGEGVFTDRPPP